YIDHFQSWPNINITYVTDPLRGPFDDIEKNVWSYDSPFITSRHYQYTALSAAAKNIGARVILDGLLGELGPTCHGEGYYSELLVRMHWIRLFRELRLRKKIDSGSIKSELLKGLAPYSFLNKLRHRTPNDAWVINTPLRSEFVNQYAGEFRRDLM